MALKQPVGQKRLTNIAIVRYKAKGKRFEIACYKNKVLNWREGIEKDLNEVIQTETIFDNVSKGIFANKKDLETAFGTSDQVEICRLILKKGDLQVSDKEREVHVEGLLRDIVQIVVERCIHPQSGRQLTAITIDNALKTIGFSVQSEQPAKKQALKAIEALCTEIPDSFARAKMRLRITCPDKLVEEIRTHLTHVAHAQIEEESGAGVELRAITFLCEPSHYRELDRLVTVTHAGNGLSIQILTSAVLREGGDTLGSASADFSFATRAAPPPPAALDNQPRPTGEQVRAPMERKQAEASEEPKKKGLKCSSCSAELEDAVEYRKHCKTDWHNFNVKRKVKSLVPVSEEEFAEISLDVSEGFRAVDS